MGFLSDLIFGKPDDPNALLRALAEVQKRTTEPLQRTITRTPNISNQFFGVSSTRPQQQNLASQITPQQKPINVGKARVLSTGPVSTPDPLRNLIARITGVLPTVQQHVPQTIQQPIQRRATEISWVTNRFITQPTKPFSSKEEKRLKEVNSLFRLVLPARTAEEEKLKNQALVDIGFGFAGTAPSSGGGKLLTKYAKKVKLSPEQLIERLRSSKLPFAENLLKKVEQEGSSLLSKGTKGGGQAGRLATSVEDSSLVSGLKNKSANRVEGRSSADFQELPDSTKASKVSSSTLKISSPTRKNFIKRFDINTPSQSDYNTYLTEMKAQEKPFLNELRNIVDEVNGEAVYRFKTQESIGKKLARRNKSGRFTLGNINDQLGSTLLVRKEDDIEKAISVIERKAPKKVSVERYNSFLGYRARHIDYEIPNGAIAEIQVNTVEGLPKKEFAHVLYDKWRKFIEVDNASSTYGAIKRRVQDVSDALSQEFTADTKMARKVFRGELPIPKKYIQHVKEGIKEFRQNTTINAKGTKGVGEKLGLTGQTQRVANPLRKDLSQSTGEVAKEISLTQTPQQLEKQGSISGAKGFRLPGTKSPRLVSSRDIIADAGKITSRDFDSLPTPVEKKVNLLDYLRTPDRVLKKIGLEKESDLLRAADQKYRLQLPKEIGKITAWSKRAQGKNASKEIFRYLDGEDVQLSPENKQIATEIQNYLSDWADKLKLPKDRRVSSYITHIFEKDFIRKEFDENLAKLIRDKVPGSVYDPFLQQRLGKLGFRQDAWSALDAYVKRATRKFNMDPALAKVADRADDLPLDSFNYIKNYTQRINLRPSDLDNLLDNFIKSSPIKYRLGGRPTTVITKGIRNTIYRGTLGLNLGSAVKNLTQSINTYAQLGERWTLTGAFKLFRKGAMQELDDVGVLSNRLIEDRSINAVRKGLQKVDDKLWFFFDMAEKINRGVAYFGAKGRALNKGKTVEQAVQEGIDMARKTQFTFGSIDTPVALQNDLTKLLTQFQSFNIKQAEFLGEMIKNKNLAGILRFTGATAVMLGTVGKSIGMDWRSIFPTVKVAQTPAFDIAGAVPKVLFGDERTREAGISKLKKSAFTVIPAGLQIKKTGGAILDDIQGGSRSPSGALRFPVKADLGTAIFGSSRTPQAGAYYDLLDTNLGPISANQEKVMGNLVKETGTTRIKAWALVQTARVFNNAETKVQRIVDNEDITEEDKQKQVAEIRGVLQSRLKVLRPFLSRQMTENEELFFEVLDGIIEDLNDRSKK